MNPWQFFTWFFQNFNTPFQTTITAVATNLSDAVQGPATAGATLYILWTGYKALYLGDSGNPILDLVRACMRVVLVMGCLSVATYTGTFTQLLLTTLPTELAQAVTGAGTVGAGAFDTLATAAFTSTVQNLNNLPVSLKSIPLGFFDILYLLGAGVAIVIAFALWLIVQVGIGLLVAVGPLAIACLITPQTARFFHGWLSSIVTALVAQVMIVATVAVMVVTIKSTLGQVLTVNAATGKNANDVIGQILSMLGAGMAFGLLTLVCLNINRFASAIGGGAAAEISGAARWATGTAASGAGAAVSAAAHPVATAQAAQAGLSKAGDAGMRSIKAVGRAL